jgi:hypothetical protein
LNRKSTKTKRRRPSRKPRRPVADVVRNLAASGFVEDEIAQRLGVHKNVLRARHIDSIKAGKAAAAASEADVAALTVADYHVLQNIEAALASEWNDAVRGCELWPDADGRGSRTVEAAFAAWKQRGGYWNTTSLSSRFNKAKAARYAAIVAAYRKKHQTQEI